MTIQPRFIPPLDPDFVPAVLWTRAFLDQCQQTPGALTVAVAAIRPDGGGVTRCETFLLPETPENTTLNHRHLERLVKFLLWSKGAASIVIGGAPQTAALIAADYRPGGKQAWDASYLGERVYRQPFTVEACALDDVPAADEPAMPLGRNLDGCRIGFDLGGSDRKCAALVDGKVVFSEEVRWDPYFENDPQYHYDGIMDTLRRAAAHLPRVDAIGGSAAGIYVNNEVRAASLFRGVGSEDHERRVRRMFFDLQREWNGVPFEVANDGEVTALAGSMSLGEGRVLGISLGTSVAGGYVNAGGFITPWLNEFAFVPVDYREGGPLDEWSGDRGCGVQYFSQQGVARLAKMAGLNFPAEMKHPEQLVEIQRLMDADDPRARAIYETIGVCFGYTIAHFADHYDFAHLLVLGRVTSGKGGDIILEKARAVLSSEFPELAARIALRTPDEKDKRHGQAVAAASLPKLG